MNGSELFESSGPPPAGAIRNVLSFDIEEYFQVSNYEAFVPFESWDQFESRVERQTERILEILAATHITATFFILGWVAERHPDLVRKIASSGHEVATHGYRHRLVYRLRPDEFRESLRRSIAILEDLTGTKVLGYRAPSFSITSSCEWALDILVEEGLRYDSSVFPIRHHRYGNREAPRGPHEVRPGLLELPPSTVRLARLNIPIAGGGYFRLYPYAVTRWGIRRLNREGLPAVVYLHPWELDPDQPRLRGAPLHARFRHCCNLHKTENRLETLCRDFRFVPARDKLDGLEDRRARIRPGTEAPCPGRRGL